MDNVKPGQKKIRAEALNDAIKGGRLSTGTRVRGGRQSQVGDAGQVIDASKQNKRKLVPVGTVRPVIVRNSPSPTAGWVRVQQVRYGDWPVQPCTDAGCHISLFGPQFDVRPYYGKKDSSYKEWEVVGDTLDISKTFFDIQWDGRQWILEGPKSGGGTDIAVVVGIVSTSFVSVKRLKKSDGVSPNPPAGTPYLPANATAETVRAFPNTDNLFWSKFLGVNFVEWDANAVPVLMVLWGGDWVAVPTWAWNPFAPSSALPAGDCA